MTTPFYLSIPPHCIQPQNPQGLPPLPPPYWPMSPKSSAELPHQGTSTNPPTRGLTGSSPTLQTLTMETSLPAPSWQAPFCHNAKWIQPLLLPSIITTSDDTKLILGTTSNNPASLALASTNSLVLGNLLVSIPASTSCSSFYARKRFDASKVLELRQLLPCVDPGNGNLCFVKNPVCFSIPFELHLNSLGRFLAHAVQTWMAELQEKTLISEAAESLLPKLHKDQTWTLATTSSLMDLSEGNEELFLVHVEALWIKCMVAQTRNRNS